MSCPICAADPADTGHLRFYEGEYWRVALAPNQSLLGRCVLSTRRHVGDLAALERAEIAELFALIGRFEAALRGAFSATMFNWSCYMNHHYREDPPDPHVHWWCVPRYARPVGFAGETFTDPHFGGPYDHARWQELPLPTRRRIVGAIEDALGGAVPGSPSDTADPIA